jgi:AcrR family transcriptional regulator
VALDIDNLTGRELVLEVACELFMAKGYDGVSMQQIASAAHMTKGSPYYHFKGKEDLFAHAVMHRVVKIHSGLVAALEGDGPLRERLVAAVAYLLANTDSGMVRLMEDFQRVIGPERCRDYSDQMVTPDMMMDTYRDAFARAEASGMRLRLPPERAAFGLSAMLIGTLHMCHVHGEGALTPEHSTRLAAETVDLFLEGAVIPDGTPA